MIIRPNANGNQTNQFKRRLPKLLIPIDRVNSGSVVEGPLTTPGWARMTPDGPQMIPRWSNKSRKQLKQVDFIQNMKN